MLLRLIVGLEGAALFPLELVVGPHFPVQLGLATTSADWPSRSCRRPLVERQRMQMIGTKRGKFPDPGSMGQQR